MADPRMMKRMQKEALKVAKLTLENDGYYVDPKTLDGGQWDVYIQGPADTIWETGVFKLLMSFPPGYPFKPVKINFVSGIWHPNVGSGGTICLDVIKSEQWSPSTTLGMLFSSIRSLLSDPNPDSPMNGAAAKEFKEWVKMAEGKRASSKYEINVKKTIEQFGNQLPGMKRQVMNAEKPDEDFLQKQKLRQEREAREAEKQAEKQIQNKGVNASGVSTGVTTGVIAGVIAGVTTGVGEGVISDNASTEGENAGVSGGVSVGTVGKRNSEDVEGGEKSSGGKRIKLS